jgi:excisionase family DNA binding protein
MKKPLRAEPSRLLTVTDLATMLAVSSRHIYRMIDAGRMPRPIKLGGSVRWDRRIIEDWIAAGCPSPEKSNRK